MEKGLTPEIQQHIPSLPDAAGRQEITGRALPIVQLEGAAAK